MSELLDEPVLEELPTATIRDEIRLLRQLMGSNSYVDFLEDLGGELERCKATVWDDVPQNMGDEKQREQAIGAAKWLEYARDWFTTQLKAYEHDLSRREAPPV